jgi:hypothetical protein
MAEVKMITEKRDMFVVVDGIKIAKRGRRNTPQAGTWVSIKAGWEVLDGDRSILIKHNGARTKFD